MKRLIIFIFLFITYCHTGIASDVCLNPSLDQQPIQADGRVMPLGTYTRQIQKLLFPKHMCKGLSASTLYCYLSLDQRKHLEATHHCKVQLIVEHKETKALLALPTSANAVSPDVADAHMMQLMTRYRDLKELGKEKSGFGNDISHVLTRLQKLHRIETGEDWTVLTQSHAWITLQQIKRTVDTSEIQPFVMGSLSHVTPKEAKLLNLERLYDRSKPFSLAIFLCLIGFLFSLLAIRSPRFYTLTWLGIFLTLGIETYGVVLRTLISGRSPVTNMYETVMWSGIGILILSAIMGFKWKDAKIWSIGLAANTLVLFMMRFASSMLDPSIKPLVPVLRDNFWLSTHVTTITFSYACFALSWFVANTVLISWLFGNRSKEGLKKWNHVTRIAIQVGTVLLAAGVILGGVWADYSWGRFWGWDPKETWSLIALIVYIAILHGRYVGWFKDLSFTMVSATAFLFVLMAWFGVNYILAAGLHSYGFNSGGSIFLFSIFALQLILLAATFVTRKFS